VALTERTREDYGMEELDMVRDVEGRELGQQDPDVDPDVLIGLRELRKVRRAKVRAKKKAKR
jgi:hypothetical protein